MTASDNLKEEAPAAPVEHAAVADGKAAPVKRSKKPLPVWVVLAGIVAFFVVALVVCYLVWLLANTLQLGKRDDSYGLYGPGRVVERKTYDDIQGWGSELLIDKKADLPARLRFLLRDKERKPITDADVHVDMISLDTPPQANAQAALIMKEPGVYRGDVSIAGGGLWEARIRVKEKGNAYQITQRVAVPESDKEKAADEAAAKAAKGEPKP